MDREAPNLARAFVDGYVDAPDGRITRMSIVCSGYRPLEVPPAD